MKVLANDLFQFALFEITEKLYVFDLGKFWNLVCLTTLIGNRYPYLHTVINVVAGSDRQHLQVLQ